MWTWTGIKCPVKEKRNGGGITGREEQEIAMHWNSIETSLQGRGAGGGGTEEEEVVCDDLIY